MLSGGVVVPALLMAVMKTMITRQDYNGIL
jgi:hypothetical protein